LLSEDDVNSARHAVVVNQTFARQHFGGGDPLNQKVRFYDFETLADWSSDRYFEIVGVIADARNSGLQDPPKPEIYLPAALTGDGPRGLVVRTTMNANAVLESVRASISPIDPNIALAEAETIDSLLRHSYFAAPRFVLVMLGATAAIGLLLVIVGVFSVMAYTVSRQTHELGVRMALGAQQRDVLVFVLKRGAALITAGAVAGLLGSIALTRLLTSQIWGVSPTDPSTLSTVIAIVLIVGLGACLLPARRASRVDPLTALHYE
jgi:putative ABC transport system permease protein